MLLAIVTDLGKHYFSCRKHIVGAQEKFMHDPGRASHISKGTAITNFLGDEGTMILTVLEQSVGLGMDDLVSLQQTVVNGLDVKLLCKAAGQILEA